MVVEPPTGYPLVYINSLNLKTTKWNKIATKTLQNELKALFLYRILKIYKFLRKIKIWKTDETKFTKMQNSTGPTFGSNFRRKTIFEDQNCASKS